MSMEMSGGGGGGGGGGGNKPVHWSNTSQPMRMRRGGSLEGGAEEDVVII